MRRRDRVPPTRTSGAWLGDAPIGRGSTAGIWTGRSLWLQEPFKFGAVVREAFWLTKAAVERASGMTLAQDTLRGCG